MYEIIMTVISHIMLILSTAGQHYLRTLTGFLSIECGSDSPKVMNRKFEKSE
jgi:hypothetical protein